MSINPKQAAYMKKYGVSEDKTWLLPGGRARAMLHSEVMRIGFLEKVEFEEPRITDSAEYGICISGFAKMGNQRVWVTGEAHPRNCKNPYFFAMAQKRWQDRCILILTGIHGVGGIYSEDEMDEPSSTEGGERSPPAEDAIEKAYMHVITQFCKNKADVDDFVSKNKGMLGQLRKAAKERVWDLLSTISKKQEAA
jgi:hypothetical protein